MAMKVLLLGRPGSGKTTAAHYLAELASAHNLRSLHIDDYDILCEKFQADTQQHRFRSLQRLGDPGSFDILDFAVMDETLEEVEIRARQRLTELGSNGLLTLEFARDDYWQALKCFTPDFLYDALIFFFAIDADTSIKRVQQRFLKTGHHLVSERILRDYYHDVDLRERLAEFESAFGIYHPIEVYDNTGSWRALFLRIRQFFTQMLEQEIRIAKK